MHVKFENFRGAMPIDPQTFGPSIVPGGQAPQILRPSAAYAANDAQLLKQRQKQLPVERSNAARRRRTSLVNAA